MPWVIVAVVVLLALCGGRKRRKPEERDELSWIDDLEMLDAIFGDDD